MKTARVIEEHKTNYIIVSDGIELLATVRGSFFSEGTFPKVGDYVSYEPVSDDKAVIEEILPRTSTVTRQAPETGELQIIVANVDVIFIIMGLDNDFNLNRLERYLSLAEQSKVAAVVILNKSDKVENLAEHIALTEEVAGKTPVYAVGALTGEGMEAFLSHITPETTAVLLGSSGAGKSTITNWLLKEDKQQVGKVREDDSRGRHTTTARQLFELPTGGFLIDTPGMRELSVVDTIKEAEELLFMTIDVLANDCQFANCDHEKSVGCAILEALASGEVEATNYQKYLKHKSERAEEESTYDTGLTRQQKQKLKKLQTGSGGAKRNKR